MSTFIRCLFGPSLLRLNLRPGLATDYEAGRAERWADTILSSLSVAARILAYTSPLVLPWAVKLGWASHEGIFWVGKFLTGLGVVVFSALLVRAAGRSLNPAYTQFISTLAAARQRYTSTTKAAMARYDFYFSAWPVDWQMESGAGRGGGGAVIEGPGDILPWLLTHSFGISLVYPGSMGLMQTFVERPLLEGRTKLVMEHAGQRNKVITADSNQIDTMFVDRRNRC